MGKKNRPIEANRKVMPTTKPGARKTGTTSTEIVSKGMSLTEAVPKEATLIDTNFKDTKVDNAGIKVSRHRSTPAAMEVFIMLPYRAGGGDRACGVDYTRKEYMTSWSGA